MWYRPKRRKDGKRPRRPGLTTLRSSLSTERRRPPNMPRRKKKPPPAKSPQLTLRPRTPRRSPPRTLRVPRTPRLPPPPQRRVLNNQRPKLRPPNQLARPPKLLARPPPPRPVRSKRVFLSRQTQSLPSSKYLDQRLFESIIPLSLLNCLHFSTMVVIVCS